MNEYDVKRLALVFAIQAEIEGMKAENIIRTNSNYALAYNVEEFDNKATELRQIASMHNDQL